ncbi:MAG: cytochrome c [Acidobacteriota bacterium]
MTRSTQWTALGGSGVLCAALLLGPSPAAAPPDAPLPALGTELGQFPPGPMKEVADQACLNCHSADITLQQRLTQKQWTAAIDKMVRWGAPLPEDKKDALIAYLVEHFGPDNDRFQPVVARPASR